MPDKNNNFTITKITPIEYCGKPRFFQLEGIDNSYEPPFETKPTSGEHDFNTCLKCQEDLLTLVNILTKMYNGNESKKGFPNCCEGHSKLKDLVDFKISDFENEPTLVANKIIYTYSHIRNFNASESFYRETTDYIDYTIKSFGKMLGIVDPLFLNEYIFYLKFLVNQSIKIDKDKKKIILDYLESYFKPSKNFGTDLNILIKIYEKWLNEFPFELNSYFVNLKELYEKQIPLFNGPPEINKYSGTVKIKPHTKSSLIEFLSILTNDLLTQINGVTLHEKGLITDSNKLKLDLVICDRKLKLKQGYLNTSKDEETQYRKIIKAWFADEKRFFDEITPLLKALPPQQIENKTEKLNVVLGQYGFFELPLVKFLSDPKKESLVELLNTKEIPYIIAMLDYLGFLKYLETQHFDSKYQLYKEVSKWFGADKEGRTVKGNISTLSKITKENKRKYTAHLHKETVIKDYQNLK